MGSFIMTASLFSSPILGVIIGLVVAISVKKTHCQQNNHRIKYSEFFMNLRLCITQTKNLKPVHVLTIFENNIRNIKRFLIIDNN